MQADLTPLRAEDFVPYGQPPEVVLAAATRAIEFWEMQRAQQDERRKELLKRERDEKEDVHRRAQGELQKMGSDIAALREDNKRLKTEQEQLASETRTKLSQLIRSKRKVAELYWKLKDAWQRQHGSFPDELLREESATGMDNSPSPGGGGGGSSDYPIDDLSGPPLARNQREQSPSAHLVPIATRAVPNTPIIRSVASPFPREREKSPFVREKSPFARAGIASPKKSANSIASTSSMNNNSNSSSLYSSVSSSVQSSAAAASPFASLIRQPQPPSVVRTQPTTTVFSRMTAATQPMIAAPSPSFSMRPNSLMEHNQRPVTPASFSSKFLL